jgi:RND family efflux transporter MFP subunit
MVLRPCVAPGVACLVVLTGCSRGASDPAGPPSFPPAVVKLATANPAPIENSSEYIAVLKSLQSTAVQPQIDGQVVEIFVRSGDHVDQGQRLVQIDASRQQAAVSSQEAERAAREADVAYARQQYQRSSDLLAAGAISKQEQEQTETSLRTAEARLQSLQAQLTQQEVQLRYFTVTAPTAGIIGDVPVRVGHQVTPQTVLTTIDQNATLELNVQVPVERAGDLKNGLPIRVLTGDGASELGTTTVSFVSPRVDDQTQSILVKGFVRNPQGAMRAAQSVRAQIVWNTGEGIVVPITAALRINGQYFAFVAEDANGRDGKPALVAKQRAIKVGPIAGDNYSVLEGLKPGDRIVVSGTQKLADNAPIAPAQ